MAGAGRNIRKPGITPSATHCRKHPHRRDRHHAKIGWLFWVRKLGTHYRSCWKEARFRGGLQRLRWQLVRKVAIEQSVLLAASSASWKIASAAHRLFTDTPAAPPPPLPPTSPNTGPLVRITDILGSILMVACQSSARNAIVITAQR